ncbi:MAG: nitrile hydratase subunit alpha [Paracoccaceae bacterium]|nr:nitrile hydratase subunit alpha [Paracoccaceae bacterium]
MPHDHTHKQHEALTVEDEAGNIEAQIIVDGLQEFLSKKGLLTAREVTSAIEKLESPGIRLGARVVAKAWTDPNYKQRLHKDGRAAVQALDIPVTEARIIVVENAPTLHNSITCTLCSCYPRSILGQPPSCYNSKAYRARSVRKPHRVLSEFRIELPKDMQLIVHDGNADMRYLVLPEPPANAAKHAPVELEALVSRDHLIGVTKNIAAQC